VKNSTNDGFHQRYNVHAAVDQDSMLIVPTSLSNHPNSFREYIAGTGVLAQNWSPT
jgi:hypothetical protein